MSTPFPEGQENVLVEVIEVLDPDQAAALASALAESGGGEEITLIEVFAEPDGDTDLTHLGGDASGLSDFTDASLGGVAGDGVMTGLVGADLTTTGPADGGAAAGVGDALGTDSPADTSHTDAGTTPAPSDTATDTPSADAAAADPSADHATAAQAAQSEADADVASGDYAAASQARGNAEDEAGLAGSNDMLHGSSALDLSGAADHQATAAADERQEGADAASGNYEAARDDASQAAYATSSADQGAGGADHSGQAQGEHAQEDWAVYHQGIADDNAHSADAYAAAGDADHAAQYAGVAADHQATADDYGAAGEHGAWSDVSDSSSTVAHDTPVEDYSASTAADTHTDDATE